MRARVGESTVDEHRHSDVADYRLVWPLARRAS